MWNGPEYDCQACGACCVQQGALDGSSYVYLDREEARRMRRLGLTVVRAALGASFLGCRAHDGAGGPPTCVAFEGVVGGACVCSVYPDRPRLCPPFAVADALCPAARP